MRVTLYRRPDLDTEDAYAYGIWKSNEPLVLYPKNSVVLHEGDTLAPTITAEVTP